MIKQPLLPNLVINITSPGAPFTSYTCHPDMGQLRQSANPDRELRSMKRCPFQLSRGWTLVELLVAMTLSLLVIAGIGQIYLAANAAMIFKPISRKSRMSAVT